MSLAIQTEASALEAIRQVNFDWCVRLNDLWRDDTTDVPTLHLRHRKMLVDRLEDLLRQQTSPLSLPIIGEGGSGKTHLLKYLRQETIRAGATFVLVDMTDVKDFWVTTLQGYVDSLQQNIGGNDQQSLILHRFLSKFFRETVEVTLQKLKGYTPARLKKNVSRIIQGLAESRDRQLVLRHQDVIRAICCLNSDDFETQSIGLTWLQGEELDEKHKQAFGFQRTSASCRQIVRALSWYISLTGPTVLGFDQLDPIVHQIRHQPHGWPAEQEVACHIVRDIGNGFADLRELFWTFPVVTCIENTWSQLHETVMSSLTDRFESPHRLEQPDETFATSMITGRLQAAYQATNFSAPYETWPFQPDALANFHARTPRALLKACNEDRLRMLMQQQVWEVSRLGAEQTGQSESHDFAQLNERFDHLRITTSVIEYLEEAKEDRQLAPLLVTAMRSLVAERADQLPDNITAVIDEQFSGKTSAPPLHARLRLIFHDENEREEHYSVRALQRSNSMAFQNRLRSAMNHAGISQELSFRRLTILRQGDPPRGKVTSALLDTFEHAGGHVYQITDEELRTLVAVNIMFDDDDPLLDLWLRHRRPLSQLSQLSDCLLRTSILSGTTPPTPEPPTHTVQKGPANGEPTNEVGRDNVVDVVTSSGVSNGESTTNKPAVPETIVASIPIGRVVNTTDQLQQIPVGNLARHTMIMGASGSGKSVAVRRLVEGAALAGIPSVIIDGAGDMSTFDEQRPSPSPNWLEGDEGAARQFHEQTEQIIYTPGTHGGRPLSLSLIPDFVPLRHDDELLQETVAMAVATISELAATGTKEKSSKKTAIVSHALAVFAKTAPRTTLPCFIDFLSDLPEDARMNIQREDHLAREIVDNLRIQQVQNPLLNNGGDTLDGTRIFGRTAAGRTPITTISLVGLPEESQRTTFLNQLAVLLFRWVKANPTPAGDRPLHGLLVIDEAADFIPSAQTTACKASLRTLAAQARKYGLGMVLATQHPKGVDNMIVANCGTQFYGRMGSPAAVAAAEDILKTLNAPKPRVASLPVGQFWFHSADSKQKGARLLQLPESLSRPTPLSPDEIQSRAARLQS